MIDFAAFYEREFSRLVRALGVGFGPESAADAVQEAFVRADRAWDRVSELDDPAGWVRRVAVNRLLNGKRNRRRRQEILLAIRPIPVTELSAELIDLRAAVRELPAQMRAAVVLHYLSGLSVAEVADTLAVSTGTIKSNLHDARERLRAVLAEVSDV